MVVGKIVGSRDRCPHWILLWPTLYRGTGAYALLEPLGSRVPSRLKRPADGMAIKPGLPIQREGVDERHFALRSVDGDSSRIGRKSPNRTNRLGIVPIPLEWIVASRRDVSGLRVLGVYHPVDMRFGEMGQGGACRRTGISPGSRRPTRIPICVSTVGC